MGEHVVPLDLLFEFAGKLLAKFQQAQKVSPKPVQVTRLRWKQPNPGKLKTNFNGAVFGSSQGACIGVVVRNFQGEIMAALSEMIPMPLSIFLLETLAARRAVLFIQ